MFAGLLFALMGVLPEEVAPVSADDAVQAALAPIPQKMPATIRVRCNNAGTQIVFTDSAGLQLIASELTLRTDQPAGQIIIRRDGFIEQTGEGIRMVARAQNFEWTAALPLWQGLRVVAEKDGDALVFAAGLSAHCSQLSLTCGGKPLRLAAGPQLQIQYGDTRLECRAVDINSRTGTLTVNDPQSGMRVRIAQP